MPKGIIVITVAYLLGSIPFGLIIGKAFYSVDIRNYGSGNIGATNIYRTLGPVAALLVFGLDLLKGILGVGLAKIIFQDQASLLPAMSVLAGLAAILGHSYSIFLGFSGGKGVTTGAGVLIMLWWWIALVLFGIWLIVVSATRYVSLASLTAAVAFPLLILIFYPQLPYLLFSLAAALTIIVRHRSNISRLLAGRELKLGQQLREED
jgi:glycerol-3-phosphate acyltransferase PlsY